MSEPSQLRMGFRRWDALPPVSVPHGYGLRVFRNGDEPAWQALLNEGEFGEWDRARLDAMIGGARAPMPLDGVFFITCNDQPVGAICSFFHSTPAGIMPELGWLVVARAHRGHKLARMLCIRLLADVRSRGFDYCYLKTEDVRLAAIATYLRVGFEPELQDDTQPARWRRIMSAIHAYR